VIASEVINIKLADGEVADLLDGEAVAADPGRREGESYAQSVARRLNGRPHLCHMDSIPGEPDEERKPYECIDGVAIINIVGLLTPSASWWANETEYGQIIKEVSMAADDPEVTGILLRVNSPGGYTDGAFECAQALANAAKKKPMCAAVDSMAYSAAYLLAAQANKIYAPPITGGVGSVGVYMTHLDYSRMYEKIGIDATIISAGEGKAAGHPLKKLSKEVEQRFQAEVDRLYGEFVGFVARGRGMTVEAVRALGAWTYHGPEALSSKLADVHGSFDDAWSAMAIAGQQKRLIMASAASSPAPRAQEEESESPIPAAKEESAAASAVVSNHKEKSMDEKNKADATQGAPAAAPPDYNAAVEIAELCALAGRQEMTAEFLTSKATPADVRKKLQAERIAKQSQEIDGRATGTGMKQTDIGYTAETNPLLAACEKRAKGAERQKGVN
jgi:signal peptide peptidase SppA